MHSESFSAAKPDSDDGPWYKGLTRYHWFVFIVAALGWLFAKDRLVPDLDRPAFPGLERISRQLSEGEECLPRRRVGLIAPRGGPPLRPGMSVLGDNHAVGRITSGAFSHTLATNIAMAYLEGGVASTDAATRLHLCIRQRECPVALTPLPFVSTRYYRRARSA